jgi:hypothetical protein
MIGGLAAHDNVFYFVTVDGGPRLVNTWDLNNINVSYVISNGVIILHGGLNFIKCVPVPGFHWYVRWSFGMPADIHPT